MKRFVYLICFFSIVLVDRVLAQVPSLNSLPTSTYVLYLDFDGHSDNSGWWSSSTFPDPIVTSASSLSSTQITEVFNRVAEDYRPFDINVTTQASVYNAAPSSKRQRIVITGDSEFYTDENGGAGGVAYLNTFGGGEIAGYVFTNFLGGSAKNTGEAASHEAGHTLGLNHHSRFTSACAYDIEYNPGQGSGETDWAPIMGNGYGANMTLWYHGATNGATCTEETQNDLSVITTNNGFTYRTDDVGNTIQTSVAFLLANNAGSKKGIITTAADVDVHKINITTAGFYSFSGVPTAHNSSGNSGANLDVKMWITNGGGTVLSTADPATTLNASITGLLLQTGIYYVFIEGTGNSNYTATGGLDALDYGSIGEYTLSVSRACTPVITSTSPGSRCGSGTVVLSATASDGVINWFSAQSGGTAITTGNSFTTPVLSQNTTYYAVAVASGCGSTQARTAVLATINTSPATNAGADLSVGQGSGNLTLSGTPTGGTWSGTGVSTGGIFSTAQSPGVYSLVYCASNGTCQKCDTTKVTIQPSATQVSTPVINPGTGSFAGAQTITLTCATAGASIYYTTTGNTPVVGTGFTRLYTGPFVVSQTSAVKAIGIKSGLTNSAVATVVITITGETTVATPVITPPTGSYSGQQTVSISCATTNATIYYTTNGNVPSTSVNSFTKVYSGAFAINASATIRAVGVKPGLNNSAVAVSFLTITNATPTVATPVITPPTGSYTGTQSVAITCSTSGASIYYTTSGNTPVIGTGFTKLYTGPFLVPASATVRAMGVKSGSNNSGVAVSFITITGAGQAGALNREHFQELFQPSECSVFPNPTLGQFTLRANAWEGGMVKVYDTKGLMVSQFNLMREETEVNIQALHPGLYTLWVVCGEESRMLRVIKQ